MTDQTAPSFSALFRESLKVGCLGFGGPAGQIALMHKIFVEQRGWIDEDRFQRMLAFCMLLPGPEAQQLATYIGWRLKGAWGAVVAGWLFVLPGALVVLGLSWFYVVHGQSPIAAAAFDGIKAAVVALVAEALLKISKKALKTRAAIWIAAAAFVALMLGAPFPLVILAAGVAGAALSASPLVGEVAPKASEGGRSGSSASSGTPPTPNPSPSGSLAIQSTLKPGPQSGPGGGGAGSQALLWLMLWLAPLGLLAATLGRDHVLVEIGVLFSVLACVTFGGAYALLAYLTTEAAAHGWLTPEQMIDGLGLAETTPGPLVLVNEFVGFLAGWGEGGLMLALAGAALAAWCTFAPSFVWIFAAAPYAEKLQSQPRAAGALAAITAAVLGVIAKLALMFAAHALFSAQIPFFAASLPDVTRPIWWLCAIALAAGVALIRFKVNMLLVLLACAVIGVAAGVTGAAL